LAESPSSPNRWDTQEPESTYQSLNILSVVGLVVGCSFGLIVLVGSLAAFLGTTPFILPLWAGVFPLVAVLAGWIALAQIRDSAGALTGRGFAWAGINGAVITGLVYFTYFMANNLAVRQQAQDFANDYLSTVAKGQTELSFLYMLKPAERPNSRDVSRIRPIIEVNYNAVQDLGQMGPFTQYQLEFYVRLLTLFGEKASFKMVKAGFPDFEEGGYVVPLMYEISTDAIVLSINMRVHSTNTAKGREWYLMPKSVTNAERIVLPAGEKLEAQAKAAAKAIQSFQKQLTRMKVGGPSCDPDFDGAFLDSVAGVGLARPTTDAQKADFAMKRDAFFGPADGKPGRFLKPANESFYCDANFKDKLLSEINKAWTVGSGYYPYIPTWFNAVTESGVPFIREKDGELTYTTDCQIGFIPRSVINGKLVLKAAKGADSLKPESWRISSLELVRGRNMPRPTEQKQ